VQWLVSGSDECIFCEIGQDGTIQSEKSAPLSIFLRVRCLSLPLGLTSRFCGLWQIRSVQGKSLTVELASPYLATENYRQQIRLMQIESYSLRERESFRLQVFKHVTRGMVEILRELDALGLSLSVDNQHYAEQVQNTWDPGDGEPFSTLRYHALSCLWDDHGVQTVWKDREIYGFPARLVITLESSAAKLTRFILAQPVVFLL